MTRRIVLSAAAFVLLSSVFSPLISAQSGDGVALSVRKGPAPSQVTLQWAEGFTPYSVYRGTDPATVTDPANRLLITDSSFFIDGPPAAPRLYYAVKGPALVSIEVAPTHPGLPAGYTQPFTATAILSDGSARDITDRVTWTSSVPAVATIDNIGSSKGVVTGVAAGTTQIGAQLYGISGSTPLSVTNAQVVSIEVSPPGSRLPIGFSQRYQAIATFTDGSNRDITSDALWSSTLPGIASVSNAASSKGVVTGVAPGQTQISVQSGGTGGSTPLTVTDATLAAIEVSPPGQSLPAGFTVHCTATGTFSDGSTRDITERVTWSSSMPAIGTVNDSSAFKGLATGVAPGLTQISAESDGVLGSTPLTVTDATLTTIEPVPGYWRAPHGFSVRFTAIGTFTDKSTRDITTRVVWSSSMPAIGTVNNSSAFRGVVTTLTPGLTQISAQLNGVTGTTPLIVTSATVVSIEVSPPDPSVPVGLAQQLQATAILSDGTSYDVSERATWTSSMAPIGTVSNGIGAKGLFTALSPGITDVTAHSDGVSGSTSLTVTAATPASIEVSPPSSKLPVGLHVQIHATATFSDGRTYDVTQHATWTSSAPTFASVSNAAASKGVASPVASGTTQISATYGSVSGGTLLTVTGAAFQSVEIWSPRSNLAAGVTRQLVATAIFSDGTSLDVTEHATWSTSNPAIAAVSNGPATRGVVRGIAMGGPVTVTARAGGVEGGTVLTVSGATFQALEVAPPAATVPAGFTQQLTATATFSDGTTEDVSKHVTWTSSAPTIGSVSNAALSRGQLTGSQPGTSNITATYGSISGGTVLTVSGATLQSVEVAAPSLRLPIGFSQRYQALGNFSDGTNRDIGAHATWTSSNPAFASVSNAAASKGVASPVAPGTTQITATAGGIAGGLTLTITGDFLQSIEVSPPGSSLPVGYRQQFQATAILSDGSCLDVTEHATWTTSNPGFGTVSNAGSVRGQASGLAAGVTQIGATVGSVAGGTVVTIVGSSLQSLEVTPPHATLSVGYPVQAAAIGVFFDGTVADLSDQVTWTSSNPGIASISNSAASKGVATPVAAGTTQISASSGAVSGGTVLTISGAALLAIEVSPPGDPLPAGFTQHLIATATYEDGHSDDVTDNVTWTSSNPTIATVSNSSSARGLATGVAPGITQISAQAGSVTGGTVLTISGAFLVAIEVSPSAASLPAGFSLSYTALATFSDGSSRDVTERATWTTSNPTIASVSNSGSLKGVVTGVAPGVTQIDAHVDGVGGGTTLTVTSATLVSIEVTPPNPALPAGHLKQVSGVATFSDGSSSDVTSRATWTSSNPAIASVSNAAGSRGLVTTNAPGNAQISAVIDGVSGATTVTVVGGPGGP